MKATKLLVMGLSIGLLASCGGSESKDASGSEATAEKMIDGKALAADYCECLETKEAMECAELAINHAVDLATDAEQLKAYEATIAPCTEAAEAKALEKMEEDLDKAMEGVEESMDEESESTEEGTETSEDDWSN